MSNTDYFIFTKVGLDVITKELLSKGIRNFVCTAKPTDEEDYLFVHIVRHSNKEVSPLYQEINLRCLGTNSVVIEVCKSFDTPYFGIFGNKAENKITHWGIEDGISMDISNTEVIRNIEDFNNTILSDNHSFVSVLEAQLFAASGLYTTIAECFINCIKEIYQSK